ncbi:MAG: DUF1003 domain-containing protein [Bdellovibrionaceae bacterium]|nr:DUF1003 domain-containing protein [Bdellovibrio sp.]
MNQVDRNIAIIHRMRKESDERRTWQQKLVDDVAGRLGMTETLIGHLIFYGLFIVAGIFCIINKFMSWEQVIGLFGTVATVETLFLTIFVLINQRRTKSLERRNSDLHLQMSLLSEHEITRLIRMTDSIVKHLNIQLELDPKDVNELKKDVDPDLIIEKIFEHEALIPTDSTSDDI